MARSSDINQRIVLTGAEEVRRHLESIGAAGEKTGNTIRASLIAATNPMNNFTRATQQSTSASRSLQFAVTNLGFQVNDIATGLASGQDAMRIFAQQAGQVFQAFQQGGGFSTVLRAAGSAMASFITPTTAAVAGLVALGAEFIVLVNRASDAQASVTKFQVMLDGTRQSAQITGKELEDAAHSLRDVGVSTDEAREAFAKFIGEGGRAKLAPQVVRIGAELEAVLGKGSMDKFIAAAAQGGPALEEFAKKLGLIPKVAVDTSKELEAAAKSTANFNQSINDAIRDRNRSIADEVRNKNRAILDLTRERGTAEEEIELASRRRIEDITRDSNRATNELIAKRNKENQDQLAAYNKTIEEAAQKSLDTGQSLLNQIEQAITGSNKRALTPLQQAFRDIGTAWEDLQNTLAASEFFTELVKRIGTTVREISDLIKWIDKLAFAIDQVPGLKQTNFGGGGDISGNAEGGLITGPGSGTSDSIITRVSNGEFVINALATKMNLPLLQAINSMRMPAMPRMRMPTGFAAGGLVGAAAGGTPVHLHISGGSFALAGERGVVDSLTRAARKSAMLSAGRKPSTA